MSIVVYQDVATAIIPTGDLAVDVRNALGASLRSMRYPTSDFAGLYQDAAGTTPVTAVGQPVGLMLDRRFGLARGPEIFPSDGDWTPVAAATATWQGGVLSTISKQFTYDHAERTISVQAGTWYEFKVSKPAEATYQVFSLGINAPNAGAYGQNHTSTRVVFYSTGATLFIRVGTIVNTVGTPTTWSDFSLREIPGNHASQPTTTARPALRSGPLRIDYDGVDDYLRTVFPALGSNVTIARSIPGVGAQILTGQTIAAGNWDDNVDSCAVLVIDRALTGPEQSMVTAFLNQQAGV